ncbi:phage major capsid protein [Mesorhizobium sp. M2D.F.Ca.ET.223.01.1.1]|uniref:phage major capsid protein n=1 Tax=Mesorhizobium sp. M2D.F.Ca.ET.223.01.1.1 TaxID=2563940 RepID=UPI001091D6C7|nr:phage major capsid protein [Mesorhizobium sp. M2D.F.Ca.ET.223.01.1.1]TGR84570.1 phage major capsid protein [Mesorhizobium sp. M2D.F.Ca.ET.223.01.1.1]TGT75173.1 phage major capsid protein [bacterium M00.F.Ca.ET.159.01.1.1]TGT88040.1 phage major capsid protein [bacterium M00.F.Ca.ET.157.01.1.1]
MALTSVEKNQEILSLALEDRSSGYQDLVSNSNVLLYTLQEKGLWKPYSGPRIRERLLYNETGSGVWYNGWDFLNPVPAELINDAEYTPKMAAVAVALSNEQILQNSGEGQLEDVMEVHIAAAEQELQDLTDASLHSAGTGFGGKELGGLQLAVPTTVNSGTYGGIDRAANPIWRTTSYDANSAFSGITQVNSTTVRSIYQQAIIARSKGKRGPDLILASSEHYQAYDAATVAIQRINDENKLGKLGFTSLKFFGAGKQMDIVLEGGIGSNMPSNVSYLLDTSSLRFRYHPERNFSKIGKAMMPINQDGVVQYIGLMGELTMVNPLSQIKIYDSNPAA